MDQTFGKTEAKCWHRLKEIANMYANLGKWKNLIIESTIQAKFSYRLQEIWLNLDKLRASNYAQPGHS